MNDYEKILQLIKYPTLCELFKLENSELTSLAVRGMKEIIKNSLNLTVLDSVSTCYAKNSSSNTTVVRIYTSFEYIKEKPLENFVDLGDVVKIKIIEWQLNISSSKVLFIEINKVFLKQFNLFNV